MTDTEIPVDTTDATDNMAAKPIVIAAAAAAAAKVVAGPQPVSETKKVDWRDTVMITVVLPFAVAAIRLRPVADWGCRVKFTGAPFAVAAAAALLTTASVVGVGMPAAAHADGGDPSTCAVLDSWEPEYGIGQAVAMALTGIRGDKGVSTDEAVSLMWDAVDTYCPSYRPQISAWAAQHH